MKNYSFYCKYIIIIFAGLITMASTIYSSQNFEDLEFYLKQFDEKKTSKDKVTSNLAIIHILLELELFDRANNRIQWHKDNIKDGYFDEKIKFYELLSLYQRGLINENISISDDFFNVQTILTGFINAEIKYKNNDFVGAYFNILDNLKDFLSAGVFNADSFFILSEGRKNLFKLHQYDISRAIIRILLKSEGPTGIKLNVMFEDFYQAVFSIKSYRNSKYTNYIDRVYEEEKDFLPAEAYRKYWYAKLLLALSDKDSFYPMLKKLRLNNFNTEGYQKIPEHIFAIYDAWFNIFNFNEISLVGISKLIEARDKLPELDRFRLIADVIYLRYLMLQGNVEEVIVGVTLLREKINRLVKFRKSVSSENYYLINTTDYFVNMTLFKAVNYIKQNNYEYEELLFDNLMGKHYQQSNNEVDSKFSLDKYDNKMNRMAIFSKYRMLNDLSKKIISKINNNPIPKIRQKKLKPFDSSFRVIAGEAINRVKNLNRWEQNFNAKTPERLTLDLKNLKKNLHEDEVFFMFTHYGNNVAQYCTTQNYHYDSLNKVDGSMLNESINNLKMSVSNPKLPYKYEDASTLYKTYFSLLEKCVKHDDQFVTILADPELISIPFNSLVVPVSSGKRQWFFEKYKYTILPSPNYFYTTKPRVSPKIEYLGVGDPKLSEQKKTDLNLSLDNLIVTRGAAEYGSIKKFPSLPETYDEIINTSLLFKGKKLLLGKDATEENLRRLILSDYQIIHFATHGITSKSLTNSELPGLLMTPVKGGEWFNDGYLNSNEIMQFPLSADLVILSACNSGVDKDNDWKFGFSDLTQSFLIAGARNVLGTQWSIPSVQTQKLVEKILTEYKINPDNLAFSFRNGILSFLKEDKFDIHPYYWASFLPLGRAKRFKKEENISITNVYTKGDGFEKDTIFNAVSHKERIYAAGISIKSLEDISPVLLEYNSVTKKISEINVGKYRTYRVGEIVNDNLILLLTNSSKNNGSSIYLAKYDLLKKQIEIMDKRTRNNNIADIDFSYVSHSYSAEFKKHYIFSAVSNLNSEANDKNAILVYVYDEDLSFEERIIIPFEKEFLGIKKHDYQEKVLTGTFQSRGKLHFFINSVKKNNSKKICNSIPFVQTFIIGADNKVKKGDTYSHFHFFNNSERSTDLIPVIKTKILNDDVPCDNYYFDIFDPGTKRFKHINHHLPLDTSMVKMIYTGKKYIINIANEVLFGIDFDALGKNKSVEKYDKDLQINYNYYKYKNLQTNILVLNDKYETEKNISFPSRSESSAEDMLATDDDTIFFLGSKDNLMSIDKFSGF